MIPNPTARLLDQLRLPPTPPRPRAIHPPPRAASPPSPHPLHRHAPRQRITPPPRPKFPHPRPPRPRPAARPARRPPLRPTRALQHRHTAGRRAGAGRRGITVRAAEGGGDGQELPAAQRAVRDADDVEQPDGDECDDVLLADDLCECRTAGRERGVVGDGGVWDCEDGGVCGVYRVCDGYVGAEEEFDLDGGCAGMAVLLLWMMSSMLTPILLLAGPRSFLCWLLHPLRSTGGWISRQCTRIRRYCRDIHLCCCISVWLGIRRMDLLLGE